MIALPPLVVGAALTPVFPAQGPGIFSLATMLGFAMLGVAMFRRTPGPRPRSQK